MTSDATTLSAPSVRKESKTDNPPAVTIFRDPSGSAWTRVYVPLADSAVNDLKQLEADGGVAIQEEPLPDGDFRAIEMAWLHAHFAELRAEYAGEWVALDGPVVVAHGATLPVTLALAGQAGHPHPFVTVIPADDPLPFYG
jgi:hypothetical protein